MKNTQKGSSVVTILIIIVILLIIGFIYYLNKPVTISNPNVSVNTNVTSEPGQPVTPAPTLTPVATGWKTFTNTAKHLSLQYPVGFTMQESKDGGFFNEPIDYTLIVSAGPDYQKGTDFNVGRIEIMTSPSTANCYYSQIPENKADMTAIRTINGVNFHYLSNQPIIDDAMGGQRGFDWLYAAIVNNQCYRVSETIGYRDSHGFSDGPYPPHYDEQQARADFDKIISSIVIK